MRVSFVTLLVAGIQVFPTGAHAQASQLAPAMTARIDSVFAMYDSRTSPGCAIGVVRDGQPVFEKGYGMSDFQHGVPITPGSIFHVASISKQFAAMSIVLLAQDGKLSLDDEVRKHVPEVPDFGKRITIRHLIHHTSGLRDQWQLLGLGGWRPDDPKSETDILWLVGRQRALNFEPGAEHLYSNTGYTLLGTIVKRVTGKTLREFTTERIFTPLGMTNTHFHDDHTMIVPGRTSAYDTRQVAGGGGSPNGVQSYAISIPVFDNAGATSLFTTVQDMAKWEQNFLNPVVGTRQTILQMLERGRLNGGDSLSYAFGLTHGQFRGLATVGHSGADAGYRSDFLRFPEQRMAFITFCNVGSANASQLNRAVAGIVLADKVRPPVSNRAASAAPITDVPIDPSMLREFAGLYVDPNTESQVEAVFAETTGTLHAGRNARGPRLRHVGNNEFVVADAAGVPQMRYRFARGSVTNVDTRMTFQRVASAEITPALLAGFAGRYRSEELDVGWDILVESDSALTLVRRRRPDQRMSASFADGFTGMFGTIRFTRDSAGKVNGFLLTSGRIRHIRFERQ
jgi:CubicO group peptidase (beta-lactamase class C family)